MAEEKQGFFAQLKDVTSVALEKTREGMEDMQQKRELSELYRELGRKTAELVGSGAVTHPDLAPLVDQIKELQAALAATPAPEAEEPPAG